MIKKSITPLFLFFFLILFSFSWQNLSKIRKEFLEFNYLSYTTPSKITGPASLEFKGIVSDFLFLKMITSMGEKIGNKERLSSKHSEYIYNSSDIITDLDPYFWDAYLFADMSLAWGFREFHKANNILLKAKINRPQDYKVPYYIGFNYFYFLKDNVNGAKYLMEAARLPNCPSYIPTLASRLSVYSLKHKTAILFLKGILSKTKNPTIAKQLTVRLNTLIILDTLEHKVDEFKNNLGYYPKTIKELVDKKLIQSIPEDPYGGKFMISKAHRVFTTSNMRYKK